MSSSIRKSANDPQAQLVNGLIDLVILAHLKVQEQNNKYGQNIQKLSVMKSEINVLEKQNEQLDEILTVLTEIDLECNQGESTNQEPTDNNGVIKAEQQNVQQKREQCDENKQSIIQVILPKLDSLDQYFCQLCNQEIIDKYVQAIEAQKQQYAKHNQQIAKLQHKLDSVDQKVIETLASFKNQRKQF